MNLNFTNTAILFKMSENDPVLILKLYLYFKDEKGVFIRSRRTINCTRIVGQWIVSLWYYVPSIRTLFSRSQQYHLIASGGVQNVIVPIENELNLNPTPVQALTQQEYEQGLQTLVVEKLNIQLAGIVIEYIKKGYWEYEDPEVSITMTTDILPNENRESLIRLCINYTEMRLSLNYSNNKKDKFYYDELEKCTQIIKERFTSMPFESLQRNTMHYYKEYLIAHRQKEADEKRQSEQMLMEQDAHRMAMLTDRSRSSGMSWSRSSLED